MDPLKKNIYLLGLNHETAPLEIRERVAFDISVLARSCAELRDISGVDEALILSTCNRTEVYCCCDDPSVIPQWIAAAKGVPIETLLPHVYIRSDEEVLTHAARLVSGMESMVIGETQISGQVKAAYQQSKASGSMGRLLHKVFEMAFSIAKQVRTNTDIGAHSVSMASASLRAVERIFPDLHQQSVLFIGAGEMISLFCEHYSTKQFRKKFFSNRTIKRAINLGLRYGGEHIDLADVGDHLWRFDIVISCTASPIPILGKGAFEDSLRRRRHKPITIFDLAVPRDIEASVSFLEDIFLFTVDDLGDLVRQGTSGRQAALVQGNKIIARRVLEFAEWNVSDNSVEILKAFRKFGGGLAQRELEKALEALKRSEDPEGVLHSFTNALTKKFLDRPSRALNSARGDDRRKLSDTLSKLFNLDDPV